jgi:rod shape-determining protein MreD
VLVTVFVAVLLQVTLARFTVGGRWVFDLVLVGVVYAALQWGPVAGMVTGTIGGLLQDLLSTGIVGVGGLTKTLVGCAAGVIGTQFVLVKPRARVIVVAGATVVHRLLLIVFYAVIDSSKPTFHWSGVSWTAILAETAINSVCAFVAFQASEGLPGVIARGRMSRRSSLSRRSW